MVSNMQKWYNNFQIYTSSMILNKLFPTQAKDEINVPIALSAFRDIKSEIYYIWQWITTLYYGKQV